MRRFLSILFLLNLVVGSKAQVSFLPLDENVTLNSVRATATDVQGFWALGSESAIGFRSGNLLLRQWTGQFWIDYPRFPAGQMQTAVENKMALCRHNNFLYAAASFKTDDGTASGVIKWNGNSWVPADGGITSNFVIHPEIGISDMVSYYGMLFVSGDFNQTLKGKKLQNLAILRADTWDAVSTGYGVLHDMHLLRDTLYVAGKFKSMDGVSAQNLAANIQGKWYGVYGPPVTEILGLGTFGNELVAAAANQILRREGTIWKSLSNGWKYQVSRIGSILEFEGKLYLSGTFADLTGARHHLLRWDGYQWLSLIQGKDIRPELDADYLLNLKGAELYFSGNMAELFGQKVNHVVQLFPGRNIVKGKLYEDLNDNCIFDGSDIAQANAIISVNEGEHFTSTDENGNYSLVLPVNGKTNLRVFPKKGQSIACGIDLIEVSSGENDTVLLRNFAFRKNPEPPAVSVTIIASNGYRARHGYENHYTIKCDIPDSRYPVALLLDMDSRLSEFKSDMEPWKSSAEQKTWLLDGNTTIKFSVVVDHETIGVGDSLDFKVHTSSTGMNTSELVQLVVSAYDPNAKQCNKAEITATDNSVQYHIQFQNLGNDSAVNIHVVDTISRSLPMQYIQILQYSHQQNYEVGFKVRDHAIIWSFKNIMLAPKSLGGDAGSSGFITFDAGLISDLKVGSTIENQAHIYFDFQPPVATNRATTEVVEAPVNKGISADDLQVFPNPGKGIFTLDMAPYAMKEVQVYDANGRKIYGYVPAVLASTATLDLSSYTSGVYVLRVTYPAGVVSKKICVVK